MIEHSDPTDRNELSEMSEPAEGEGRPLETDDLGDDELGRDPDGEAVVVPGQRPGPTEPYTR